MCLFDVQITVGHNPSKNILLLTSNTVLRLLSIAIIKNLIFGKFFMN